MKIPTLLRSTERYTQSGFHSWLEGQPEPKRRHCELLAGHIVREPPAGCPHGVVCARLLSEIEAYVRSRDLGIVIDSSAGYDLPTGDTVEPDGSFISTERFAAGPAPQPGEFLRIVPNLVIETKSPATARRDREIKHAIYERSGVDEYWIVDADTQSVDVFVLEDEHYAEPRRYKNDLASLALPGLRIDLIQVFDLPA